MTTDTQTKDSMTNQIKLIALTQGAGELLEKTAQEVISYVARVSNPNNQLNFDTSAGLLKYCIKHEHWSIFEQAYMTLEINTTRAFGALKFCAIARLHIKSFPSVMLRLHLLIQSRCPSSVVKTPRTVRIVLMTWIHSRFKTLRCKPRHCLTLQLHCTNRC